MGHSMRPFSRQRRQRAPRRWRWTPPRPVPADAPSTKWQLACSPDMLAPPFQGRVCLENFPPPHALKALEPSDEELMRRFRAGEGGAFPVLVQRHRARVFAFVLRLTQDRSRAEDALQETWLRVVRGAAGYTPTAKFTTWVYTIARNICVDAARREQHRAAEPLSEEPPDAGTAWNDPERGAASTELRPLLEA